MYNIFCNFVDKNVCFVITDDNLMEMNNGVLKYNIPKYDYIIIHIDKNVVFI